MRPEEQSEKAESCQKNLWNEIRWKGRQRQKQSQEQNEKEWASSVGLCYKHNPQLPHHVKMSPQGPGTKATVDVRLFRQQIIKSV